MPEQDLKRIQFIEMVKRNPNMAILQFLDELKKQMQEDLDKKFEALKGEMPHSELFAHITSLKGEDGVDGVDANPNEIAQILLETPEFMTLFRTPEDGKTPTDKQLLSLIKPLIPKAIPGKDGKTPSDRQIIALIKPLIPKVENGKTPTKAELIVLIKTVIDAMNIPTTALAIADLLNTKKEIVNIEVIRGWKEWSRKIQQSIREKGGGSSSGGGMGNWKHEQFTVSSATTSVTVASKIAAGGMAHMVRYQGQMLALGVHYTVSDSKVFALLFTPDDSTPQSVIDITYVRA